MLTTARRWIRRASAHARGMRCECANLWVYLLAGSQSLRVSLLCKSTPCQNTGDGYGDFHQTSLSPSECPAVFRWCVFRRNPFVLSAVSFPGACCTHTWKPHFRWRTIQLLSPIGRCFPLLLRLWNEVLDREAVNKKITFLGRFWGFSSDL